MSEKQMNILVAPNSLKGSMSAFEFAAIVEEAFLKVSDRFNVHKIPVADGGDFTGEVLRAAYKAQTIELKVNDPLGRPVVSKYGLAGKTAIIEMADASGMKLLKPGELDVLAASSFGTGQLIAAAIEKECTEILLGVGGSATVDGGAGMMEALGFRFYDKQGQLLSGNGKNLGRIHSIHSPELSSDLMIKVVTDVDNPLLGTDGAATVFGPQKGASSGQVEQLEEGLASWCRLLEEKSGKNLAELKGAGAAGGVALPLVAEFDAAIVPGAFFILSVLGFDEQVQWADVVITGEGKLDRQTLNNKAPRAVADAAHKAGKPVIAIGGTVEPEAASLFDGGAFSFLNQPVSLTEAIRNGKEYLAAFARELAKFLLAVQKK